MEKPIEFWLRKGKAVGETKPTETKRKVPTLRNQRKHRTKQGDLWEIFGLSVAFYKRVSIIMLQKSSARKGFCAEGWKFWMVKWYIQHAGSVVFTMLPA